MNPAQAEIELHLRCRVLPGQRDAFLAFLREAIPFYEAPGGIAIRLIESLEDGGITESC